MEQKTHAAGWTVRRFAREDAHACVKIFRGCLSAFAWRERPQIYVRPLIASLHRSESWVAEEPNAGVVGFLTLEHDAAYVDHLFVEADWRLCGIGGGLLQAARRHAGRPLELTVDRENRFARGAYEAMGWIATGERGGRGMNAWLKLQSP